MPPTSRSDRTLIEFGRLRALGENATQMELQRHTARLGCIVLSGYLENRFREILGDYISNKVGHPKIQRAVKGLVEIQNCKVNKMALVLEKFHASWKDELSEALAEDDAEAVDSVVSVRNAIAHGGNDGISWASLIEYEQHCKKAMETVAQLVNGAG